jgi:hypothetical protein
MKKLIIAAITGFILLVNYACQEEEALRVTYPESHPAFDLVNVAETQINYGDSITLRLKVSDNKTPLSTLAVKVVINDEILVSEVLRTKGNEYSDTVVYRIPFGPRMPDNADVEVHLKSINVEGFETDTIIFTTKAKRPVIPNVWLTFDAAIGVKLNLIDAAKNLYQAENLTLGNNIKFRVATKVISGNRIDWKGMAFGMPDGTNFGIIKTIDEPVCNLNDPTIYGFNKVTVDLFNFTVTGVGKKLEPATALNLTNFATVALNSTDHLNVTTQRNWKSLQSYLGKNVEITFTGFGNLNTSLNPDFFEVTGANTAKFTGETGIYSLNYLPEASYMYVEQPTAKFPNVLWLDGVGAGRPVAPYKKTTSWNWNSPEEYIFCKKVSAGIYQATFYAEHVVDLTINEPWRQTFSMKFFHQRNWGGEEDARTYSIGTDLLFAPTAADLGNFIGTEKFAGQAGVYRIIINTTLKTVSFTKIN